MQSNTSSVEEYINWVPASQREAITRLRDIIRENIPTGFSEEMSYGMIGYVVPHSLYPKGYHCNPRLPLPFLDIAAQKNFIAVYHMGIYSNPELLNWFTNEFSKHSKKKPDMGKSCIRFKNPEAIPYQLIGELAGKISVQEWIDTYESIFINKP
jgi:uncharacterized protein YdhG (YjbR/CyaY superfamily)